MQTVLTEWPDASNSDSFVARSKCQFQFHFLLTLFPDCLYTNYKVLYILACKHDPRRDGKIFASMKQKNSESEAIGVRLTGSLFAGYVYF